MRILLITSSFPYPIDIGRKVVISGFLHFFSARCGPENITLAYLGRDAETHAPPDPVCTTLLPIGRLHRRLEGLVWQSIVLRRRSLQEMILYSPAVAETLASLVARAEPDLVLVDTIRMAQYIERAPSKPSRTILYLDDLYSVRYQRMLATMRAYPTAALDPLGTFSRFLPKQVGRCVRASAVQRELLAFESRILSRREAELPRHFDKVLLLNANEAVELSRKSGAANVSRIKPLLPHTRNRLPRRFGGDPVFLFLGNLQYPANSYSLSHFLSHGMPPLLAKNGRARLVVIGRGASEAMKRQAATLGGQVQFLDFVEDLAPLAATAAAMIVPLLYGSGIKIKVLDALFFGLPIVSTPCGVEGLEVEDGKECFVEEHLSDFARPMLRLLDRTENQRMSDAAIQCHAEQFAPEVIAREYERIFAP